MSWSASFLSIGSPVLNTDSRFTMHLVTSGMEGTSNITRFITFSMIARKPRAPVFRCKASSAISSHASSVKVNSTPSRDRIFSYCFVNAFLGFVKI